MVRQGTRGCRREAQGIEQSLLSGGVVQLVRTPACHAGGRGFESGPYRQFLRTSEVCAGSEHFRRIARASSMRTLTSQLRKAFIFKARRIAGCASPAVLYG